MPFEEAPMGPPASRRRSRRSTPSWWCRACCRWRWWWTSCRAAPRCSICRCRRSRSAEGGELLPRRPLSGVGGRRERLREPGGELLLRGPEAARPRAVATVAAGGVAYRERALAVARERLPPARGRRALRRRGRRGARPRDRRGRVHDRHVGLPGVDDRPQLRAPADHLHDRARRQLRRVVRGLGRATASTRPARSCARRSTPTTRPAPSRAGSTGWRSTACPGSPGSTPGRWCGTSARRGRCAAGSSRQRCSEAEAHDLVLRRAVDDRARPRARGDGRPSRAIEGEGGALRIVALDTGIKRSIVRNFVERGVQLELYPCTTPADELLARDPDGFFLVPGPGDPAALDYVVDTIRALLVRKPVFGICLGHQLLSRAAGLETFKLPFGHRGANHPVKDLATGRIAITSQNHGFAVAESPARRIESELGRRADPRQPLRRHRRGLPAARRAGRLRAVPPRGRAGAERLARAVRPLHRRVRPCRVGTTCSDPRAGLGADRDRPGGRVRLLGRPGLQGPARGGLRGRARELQSGHDHDRPGVRHGDLRRAAAARAGGAGDRARAAGRAAADARRPDRAQPRQGAVRGRHARPPRRRADRRDYDAICRAEDRELFDATMRAAGLRTARSTIATSVGEARWRSMRSGCR